MTTIQHAQLQVTIKDGKCPVLVADAQPVFVWTAEGIVHVRFHSLRITDPTAGSAEASPLVEIVMPLSTFFSTQDAANGQVEQLEKQGIKRVPVAAVAPTTPGGVAH